MKTIPALFKESVKKYPNNIILWENLNGEYVGLTYIEAYQEVLYFAAGLLSLGIEKGDRIAIISEGRNQWLICDLGILFIGAVNVPLSVKIEEPTELKFRLSHADCVLIIASNVQIAKIKPILNQLPNVRYVMSLDKSITLEKGELLYSDVKEKGKDLLKKQPTIVEERLNTIEQNDLANICYTSGTTSDPKGIMLSHRNYTTNVEQSLGLFQVYEHYKTLMILPWDHSFAHTVGLYSVISGGASIASIQKGKTPIEVLKNIGKNIKQVEPYFLLSVPALARNLRTNIEKVVIKKGKLAFGIYNTALFIAYKYNAEGSNKGKGWRCLLFPIYKILDLVLFKKIRSNFGENLKFFVGGGALLDIDLQRFYYAIGIPMFQGYGLSEASPVISSNSEKCHKLGSSGKVATNLLLKICDSEGKELSIGEKGEIVIKGENVMLGYWKNPKSTEETIKDGWLYTGDMGYMDKEGYLFVLGRFKSLLIGSDGEKINPEGLEESFMQNSKYIEQCLLFNNQNHYTVMLLYPNASNIIKWLNHHKYLLHSKEATIAALKLMEEELLKFKASEKKEGLFSIRWFPSAIAILDEGFSENNHLMNSTMKIVRGKIIQRYEERIKYLYTPEAKLISNEKNIKAMEILLNVSIDKNA